MKILIVGARGQLGMDCLEVLSAHTLVGLDLPGFDMTSAAAVEAAFAAHAPDVVVNCAAFTAVDACELREAEAQAVNAQGPLLLAAACARDGARLIHISTDYVFPGDREIPRPYTEADATGPISAYGRTKREGELAVLASGADAAILRTAWLYGAHGHNFLKTMLRLACGSPQRTLRVVDDQYGSPTWSYRLAQQIAQLIEGVPTGVYHATSEGYCTWYALASRFLAAMGIPHAIEPCSSADYPTPAARPRNSILENAALKRLERNVMRPWQDDLDDFVMRCRADLMDEITELESHA